MPGLRREELGQPDGLPVAYYTRLEQGRRVGNQRLNSRFAAYRDAPGLDPGLDFQQLRRSYVTHLIEDGYDARSARFLLSPMSNRQM